MRFSRRRLTFGLVFSVTVFVSACGASDGPDQSMDTAGTVAVSASPQPQGNGAGGIPAAKVVGSKVEPRIRPGVDSPLDSAPDRISKQAGALLFATGFEEGVSLTSELASSTPFQHLGGSDKPGYSFPIDLWSAAAGLRSVIHADVGQEPPMPVAEYARSEIKSVAGRSGPTRALSLRNSAKSPRTSSQEIALTSSDLADEPMVFQRMWVKFDTGTLDRARAVGADRFYQMFWEVKAEPDFRLRLKLQYDDAKGLIWVAKGSGIDDAESYWEARLQTVPVVLASKSSRAGWHKVEIWLDRSGGRFKVAIDGQALVDRGGPLVGAGGNRISDYRMMMVSSAVAPLAEVLVDDLEFWDAPPGDAW